MSTNFEYKGVAILVLILLILVNLASVSDSTENHEKTGETRTIPDLPIPAQPLCPPGSDCANTHTCSPSSSNQTLEVETSWTATGSNRMMSSPHVIDLNGDGVLDIVTGTGIEEESTGSIIALDGANGSILWEVNASGEMFSSAQFADLDGDANFDVILGGRNHQLFAVNGINGSIIWQFDSSNNERSKWFQFYTGQFIDDQNADGIVDWLTSNGGDPLKQPGEPRDSGYLLVISGSTGEVLSVADTPDSRETYMSPLIYQPHPEMTSEILFGTGGETWDGGLWATSITDLMSGDISNATRIVDPAPNVAKGIMAPPAIVDMNLDGIQDLVVSTFDGRLIVLDGRNYSEIWTVDVKEHVHNGPVPDAESWASAAIGYFTNDSIPDVFTHFTIGAFPMYSGSISIMIDGATGQILWSEETSHTSFTSPLAVDLNGNGRDEILMIRGGGELFSDSGEYVFYNEASVFNTCLMSSNTLFNQSQMSIGTPTIVDLDLDGDLELITTTTTGYTNPTATWTVSRMDLNTTTPQNMSWAAYLGTNYDAVFESDS